jgi:hypothetical protein
VAFATGEITRMKPFQSRVVAAWIFAVPIAYGLFVESHHRIARLTAAPQIEAARELQSSQHASFASFFLITLGILVLLTVAVDALANLIRRFFPERAETPKPVA